jgi:L-lactate dehydrogenase complex protein LldG
MTARDDILAAVRAGLGGRPVDADQVRREAASLLDDPASTRPLLASVASVASIAPGTLVDVFAARVTSPKVAATLDRIAHLAELPGAVSRYLEARGLRRAIALQPAAELTALDWSGFELHATLASDEAVGVGIARWGIAETGSLVFHSGADMPILANFLPLHHLVLLHARTILAYLEDYAVAAVATGEKPPRNVNIITGASGTTDIEGSLVLGAHGPRYLHVILAAD